MKRFIIKFSLLFLIFIITLALVLIKYGVFRKNDNLNFVSNSISFNAKSSFLFKNNIKLKNANIVVLGSSMSLNNIDCEFIQKKLDKNVINLSSWSMKINDFEEFLPFTNPKSTILINISFTDFGDSWIEKYSHYPLGNQNEYVNKLTHWWTFRGQTKRIEQCTNDKFHRDYSCLNFDCSGSVLLYKNKFNISKQRWDESKNIPTTLDLLSFIESFSLFKNRVVYIFFSPERMKYKTKSKQKTIEFIQDHIKNTFSNVFFFNNYNLNFSDSMFVDCYHFNEIGAREYTKVMLHEFIASKSYKNLQGSP